MKSLLGIFQLDENKSLRPVKDYKRATSESLHKKTVASLNQSVDYLSAVKLPAGEDVKEWYAVHVVDFYNVVTIIYGTLHDSKICKCPTMQAGPFEYLWQDKKQENSKPQQVSAYEYISLSLDNIKKTLDDETIFPSSVQVSFPKNFTKIIKELMKKIFRIYAHIWITHFVDIQKLGLEAHVNTSLKHFLAFTLEFELLKKKELEPLKDYIHNRFEGKFDKQLK
ncbi:hypothetical protein ABK040_007897 [Willaertia magna]